MYADQLLPSTPTINELIPKQFFIYVAFVYAWIVPLKADQFLPQLLIN